jgi:CPA1 family monovalent cation:H+ antiporter
MELFDLIAGLLTLSALFSYLNYRWLRMPSTIGLMVVALTFSLLLVGAGHYWPGLEDRARAAVGRVPFDRALLDGMLGFLLFAGSLHVNVADLWQNRVAIIALATVGVLLSTIIVGLLAWWILPWMGFEIRPLYCFLFGALISPTDPLAVLSILRRVAAPKSWQTIISGESLFNDGVAVATFIGLLQVAVRDEPFDLAEVAMLFAREALGGAVYGLAIGGLAFLLLKSIDQYQVEVLISLALVAGGYALADALGVSGPIAMVVAGLFIGNRGRELAMSDRTRQRLDDFWDLIDEVLNSVLFVLVGLELVMLRITARQLRAGGLMIVVVLLARLASVGLPLAVLSYWRRVEVATLYVLTWGGLRGGISLAMALSLHGQLRTTEQPESGLLLPLTYIVVVFSIVAQGLSVGPLIRHALRAEGRHAPIATKNQFG